MAETYVRVDPAVRFGRPNVGGASVEVLADAIWVGEPVDEVAAEYNLTAAQVLVACWYQARYGTKAWQRRWAQWRLDNEYLLWNGQPEKVADPPSKEDIRG